jgi:glycosyltransferase involved in cell wall biosynthesis
VRVLVDLLGYTGARGGTETYAREICTRLPDAMSGAEFMAITGRLAAEEIRGFFPGEVKVVRWVGGDRVTWAIGELIAATRAARRFKADVIWTPANFGPVTRRVPRASTVHDVTYHTSSGHLISRVVGSLTAGLLNQTARTADIVITGSATAAEAIAAHIPLDRSTIRVVPHGTNTPHDVEDPWRQLAGLDLHPGRAVLLSTGNRLPHKNFEGLLSALATIPPSARPLTVITGGGLDDPLQPLVDRLDLADDVRLLGWVTRDQLESLYAVATIYVCPSSAEGFGLPVIDAMRRGLVVVANDIPVLREVGGESAIYADATSPAALGTAICGALRSPDPARAAASRQWSRQFTWESAAAGTGSAIVSAQRMHT